MRITCPGCRTPLPAPRPASCPVCELSLTGPAAAELWVLDGELLRLGRRRRHLVAALYAAPPAAGWSRRAEAGQARPTSPAGAPGAVPAGDASRFVVRNTLLGVGGALLGIAAIVFTALSWSTLGAVPRELILLALTAVALGAAWGLARRGLAATAETLGFIGLLLIGLQCYAAHANDLFGSGGVDGLWYAAGSSLAVTALWAAYGWAASLRLPAPTAVVLGRLPLPLAVLAADAGPMWMALALIVLSLADLFVRRVEWIATVTGLVAGGAGLLLALALTGDSVPVDLDGAGVLLVAASVALAWAARVHRVIAVAAGLAASVAVGAVLPLPLEWAAAGFALCAVAVAAAARLLPRALLRAAVAGAGVTFAASTVWILPGTVVALLTPAHYLDMRWAGVGEPDLADWVLPAAPLVLALLTAVLVAERMRAAAPPAALLAVLTAVVAADLPYATALALVVITAAGLAAWAVLDPAARVAAGITAVAAGLWAAADSLATQPATLAVLGALTVIAAVTALASAVLRDAAAAVAALALGGFAAALGLSAGLPAHQAAFAVLAASACALAAAWAVRGEAAEIASWTTAAAGIGMTAGHGPHFSLALAVTGVLASALSLRADRRPAAGWAASVLLAAAWWVRLGASEITVPEVYTLPVSAALLAFGVVRHVRGATSSSWVLYGPALASTLVPSLVAAWGDATGPRPLVLAVAALAVTLAGARTRLQAPLLLGGAVLVLDAARRLAPFAADALAGLPGWIPIAVLGLAVLLTGATYEQRLRDLRRLR
ncbi:SCO7613 C-terminal domain-containing membrane protein, partial [Actinomadura rubrisoli]